MEKKTITRTFATTHIEYTPCTMQGFELVKGNSVFLEFEGELDFEKAKKAVAKEEKNLFVITKIEYHYCKYGMPISQFVTLASIIDEDEVAVEYELLH